MDTYSSYRGRLVLAVVSGGIYALAYPPVGWGWLVVPGLLGLLVALRGQHGPQARAIGFLHGLTAYAVGLSWLIEIFGWIAWWLWVVLAAFGALFAEMQGRAGKRGIVGWQFAVFTALNWCGWEFIRAEVFKLKFPWMTVGLACGPNSLLPLIGVYGVSMVAVLGVALLVARRWKSAAAVALGMVVVTAMNRRCPEPAAGDPGTLKVAGLQFEDSQLRDFLAATRELPEGIQHVVWPEYAIPYDIRLDLHDWRLVQQLCSERGITLTMGTQSHPPKENGWHNIALTLDPSGVRGEHNKIHTVHFFNEGIAGTAAVPVLTDNGKTGTPICFDCDYEDITRRMTAAGAEMFIVPSMDAKSWSIRQHDQHAELFRLRACENARWMFVCATSGVSQVIDPHGHVHGRLPALAEGSLIGMIQRESRLTFYTHAGWLTPWVALAIAGICWIALLFPERKIRTAKSEI